MGESVICAIAQSHAVQTRRAGVAAELPKSPRWLQHLTRNAKSASGWSANWTMRTDGTFARECLVGQSGKCVRVGRPSP